MDNKNENNFQNVEDEAADAMTDCLGNSVILRKILEHLSSPELLQLSILNKLWKNEARHVMRKRNHLTAYVKSHDFDPDRRHPREEIKGFISDLKQMNPVPFSGISIDISFCELFGSSTIEDPDDLEGVNLVQAALLKTVSVRLHGSWLENMASLGVLLIKRVLQDCSGVLEELELDIRDAREYFMRKFVQGLNFPRLKTLKLREGRQFGSDEVGYENYMKAILSRAPNLKVLHCNWSINAMLSVLEGSSVLPVYEYLVPAPFEEISEDVFGSIKLKNMKMVYGGHEFDFARFNRITPMLLRASCSATISYVDIDAVLAVPLMSYGVRLENVKDLWMEVDYDHLARTEPRILRAVKNFDFTRIFPNLNKVNIQCGDNIVHALSPAHRNAIIERANAVFMEPMVDRAARVKELLFSRWNLSIVAAQFFAEMFPNIEKLEIIIPAGAAVQVPFGSIWNWLELKELKVTANLLPAAGNLDSIFCGIFPEEVAELRLKDDEYLKRVYIVPVMSAVTCLKNLRTLSLHHKHPLDDQFGDDLDETFLFSKVTAFLVFARLPALAVSLHISAPAVPPGMSHLKPYVSITSELREKESLYDKFENFLAGPKWFFESNANN